MAAYQAYAGEYEFGGAIFRWRCYATVPVYQVMRRDHRPFPAAPKGRKWVSQARQHSHGMEVAWQVDEAAGDFSHILLQLEPQRLPRPVGSPVHQEGARA